MMNSSNPSNESVNPSLSSSSLEVGKNLARDRAKSAYLTLLVSIFSANDVVIAYVPAASSAHVPTLEQLSGAAASLLDAASCTSYLWFVLFRAFVQFLCDESNPQQPAVATPRDVRHQNFPPRLYEILLATTDHVTPSSEDRPTLTADSGLRSLGLPVDRASSELVGNASNTPVFGMALQQLDALVDYARMCHQRASGNIACASREKMEAIGFLREMREMGTRFAVTLPPNRHIRRPVQAPPTGGPATVPALDEDGYVTP
jgi:hypothetical protein